MSERGAVQRAEKRAAQAGEDAGPVLLHVTTIPMSLTFLKGQVGFMKERGFVVHAASSPGPGLEAFSREEGVAVTAVPMPRRITPVTDQLAVLRLAALMRRIEPSIVHAHTPKGGLLGMLAASLCRVPVRVYHMRGLPFLHAEGARRAALHLAERTACALADRVVCVGPSLRGQAVGAGLCDPAKLRVLAKGSGNGVDAERRFSPRRLGPAARADARRRLGIPHDATVVGFVGRLVRDKGIVELEQAWRLLREGRPETRLLLVGPFEDEDPVPPATRQRLEEDPRVHLTGMDWNTPPLYAAMDVVALPTRREGFPNVPLEAGAMELPVVATRIPGCVDAVEDGLTGLLVPARDVGALGEALARYVLDPDLRARHGRAAREHVRQRFAQERIWRCLHDEYLSLLREKGCVVPGPAEELRDALA